MYGYFSFSSARRLRLWREEILGMPLVCVELPKRLTRRTCRRVEQSLARCRVHQLFNAPEHWSGASLPPLNPTRRVWLQRAAEAALLLLERRGVEPRRAVVEVCGERFTPETEQVILALLPQVRTISLSLPVPESFVWQLQRRFGVSPVSGEGDLSVCFSPAQRSLCLPLWMERPQVQGLALTAPLPDLPDGCPVQPLICALAEQGRLSPEEIRVMPELGQKELPPPCCGAAENVIQ